ncbi:MAG: hypothetical protein IIC13_06975 [SAR324 cluster bacterium]|nr:hypothetical protein [SAR324 cluster bacterium]
MGRIRREWLERIPDHAWVRRPGTGRKDGPEDGPPPPKEESDEGGDDGDDAADAAGVPDGGAAREDAAREDAAGEDTTGEDTGEGEGIEDDYGLDIPEEIEARRREQEEKNRRPVANPGLAPRAFGLEGHYLRNLATRFARMITKVAEDSADLPSQGDEEWDMPELLKRRFTGRLIHQCRMTREKRKVAIVLDTSPSCEHQARLFASVARIAEELGDCDLYEAPNFAIVARKSGDAWEQLASTEEEWAFKGRVVLAFGDFDGIERICEASAIRGNRIYWFCCEERPDVLEQQRETFVRRYKGKYFPATSLQQLLKAIARVR